MSSIQTGGRVLTRRAFVGAMVIGAAAGVAASPAFASAPAVLRGAGDFRALNMVNLHTSERLNCAYCIEGAYVPEALAAFNYILRDWREEEIKSIDARTLDIVAATHGLLGTSEPIGIISGYRTRKTNAMLRGRSRGGVAKNSYHIKAMAIDIALESRSVRQIAAAARSLNAGGVGRYTRSNFVHVDCGPVRDWGS